MSIFLGIILRPRPNLHIQRRTTERRRQPATRAPNDRAGMASASDYKPHHDPDADQPGGIARSPTSQVGSGGSRAEKPQGPECGHLTLFVFRIVPGKESHARASGAAAPDSSEAWP